MKLFKKTTHSVALASLVILLAPSTIFAGGSSSSSGSSGGQPGECRIADSFGGSSSSGNSGGGSGSSSSGAGGGNNNCTPEQTCDIYKNLADKYLAKYEKKHKRKFYKKHLYYKNKYEEGCNVPPPPAETGKVCGVIFLDTNSNDSFDNTDELLDNVAVNVKNENGNSIASGVTNSRGRYCISDIPTGSVTVDVDEGTLPENSGQVVGEDPSSVTVKAAENNWAGRDGYGKPDVAPQTGKVCGMVFFDSNANNAYDNSDQPIEDVTVYFSKLNGDTFATQETDSEGKYCLTNVPVGSVAVGIATNTLPENSGQVVGENEDVIDVKADTENWAGRDGYGKPDGTPQTGKVCGSVFHDVNKNGRKDASEEGSAGIFVKIIIENGDDIIEKTDASGNYCISNVPKGSVPVEIVESTLPLRSKLTVGTNPTPVVVIPNQENNAGVDGYVGDCNCDCTLCQRG